MPNQTRQQKVGNSSPSLIMSTVRKVGTSSVHAGFPQKRSSSVSWATEASLLCSQPHGFVTDLDTSLEQQVFYVPKRKRKPHVHHN